MDFGSSRLYEIELWDLHGNRIADISSLAENRHFTMERNEAETLSFSLDLFKWEDFATSIAGDARTLLNPYQVEVKFKRGGEYLFGTQIVDTTLNAGSGSSTISISCTGYLNLFKDRFVTLAYTATEATTIAAGLLTTTQAQTNGSVGVTVSGTPYVTGVLRDRTYTRDNVKTMLQNLTQLVDGKFDFAFDSNKVFHTYAQIGSRRGDVSFVFGDGGNIKSLYLDRSAMNLHNLIYGLGSGFGPDQLTSIQTDVNSQNAYYIREAIDQFNSVTEQATLDQNTLAAIATDKDLLEIPQVTITGKELENVPFLGIGDRVPISAADHPFLNNINQLYRIEKMDVTLDDADFETDIVLYFDSWEVNQNELPA